MLFMVSYTIKKEEEGLSLEKYVRKVLPNAPSSFIYKLFRKKDVRINNHWEKDKTKIHQGDIVSIYVTDAQFDEFASNKKIEPSDEIKTLFVYEDDNILIINKPRGLLVQKDKAGVKALDDMVLSYLVYKGEYKVGDSYTPGPAHRLDRNTAGLVIFGKNTKVLQYLFTLIKEKTLISKHYITLVKGEIDKDGFIDAPLKKNEKSSLVFVTPIEEGGKPSRTNYHVITKMNGYTLLDVVLESGRTHQIRVHMSYIHHPVVGDNKYGDFELNHMIEKEYGFKNQFLVANRIDFGELSAPLNNLNKKHIEVDMPLECKTLLDKLIDTK